MFAMLSDASSSCHDLISLIVLTFRGVSDAAGSMLYTFSRFEQAQLHEAHNLLRATAPSCVNNVNVLFMTRRQQS